MQTTLGAWITAGKTAFTLSQATIDVSGIQHMTPGLSAFVDAPIGPGLLNGNFNQRSSTQEQEDPKKAIEDALEKLRVGESFEEREAAEADLEKLLDKYPSEFGKLANKTLDNPPNKDVEGRLRKILEKGYQSFLDLAQKGTILPDPRNPLAPLEPTLRLLFVRQNLKILLDKLKLIKSTLGQGFPNLDDVIKGLEELEKWRDPTLSSLLAQWLYWTRAVLEWEKKKQAGQPEPQRVKDARDKLKELGTKVKGRLEELEKEKKEKEKPKEPEKLLVQRVPSMSAILPTPLRLESQLAAGLTPGSLPATALPRSPSSLMVPRVLLGQILT